MMTTDPVRIPFPIERPGHILSDGAGRLVLQLDAAVSCGARGKLSVKLARPPYLILGARRGAPCFYYGGLPAKERAAAEAAVIAEWEAS